jgi:hypothetical protein
LPVVAAVLFSTARGEFRSSGEALTAFSGDVEDENVPDP